MVKKTWTFKLGGKAHRVAIAHMSSGKGGIWVDGVLQQSNVNFHAGSVHQVYIDNRYETAVRIQENGYDLTINGVSLDEMKKRRAQRTQEMQALKVATTSSATSTSLVRQVMAKRQNVAPKAHAKSATKASTYSKPELDNKPAWAYYDETPTTEAPAQKRANTFDDDYDPFTDLDGYDEQPTEPANLSGGNWFSDEPLFAKDVYAEEKPKPAPVDEKNKKPNKKNKKNQSSNVNDDSTPAWAWVFAGACILIPIVTLGGALPGAIGFGGAAGVRQVARDRSMPVELRVALVIGIVIACWVALIVLIGGVAALTEGGLFSPGA